MKLPTLPDYLSFLTRKIRVAADNGFEVPLDALTDSLFEHQKATVQWALRKGAALVASSFGLGKTRTAIEVLRHIMLHTQKPVLVVCPLGVKTQFEHEDGPAMGVQFVYVRTAAEQQAAIQAGRLWHITNYERVRDGDLNTEIYGGVALDEGSVLRHLGTDTTQQFIAKFKHTAYKFVFTATPSPNEYLELINYADFLGVMDRGQALTRFFERDSQKAGNLTLHPQHADDFWLWVSSWALFLESPADLGFDATGYNLPELQVHWHCLEAEAGTYGDLKNRDGQGLLMPDSADSLQQAAKIKRQTIQPRLAKAMEIMSEPAVPEPFVFSNGESRAMVPDGWYAYQNGSDVFKLHSWGPTWVQFTAPDGGEHTVTDNVFADMVHLNGRWLLWHLLEDERRAIESALPYVATMCGSDSLEDKEAAILNFSHGKSYVLATKPEIAGSGCNFQRYCHRAIFMSVDYKFNDFIQSIHRIHRFGQQHPVQVHVIYMAEEAKVVEALREKWRLHNEQRTIMKGLIQQYGLNHKAAVERLSRKMGVDRKVAKGNGWTAINNDTVLELMEGGAIETDSVGLLHTSIPFGNHYEYSASYNDFGHNITNDVFWQQMDYMIPHWHRVLMPGRNAVIHVKDRIRYATMTGDGSYTIDPFSDECVAAMRKHGFLYIGRITIVTDVVRENNQTYRLGWSEKCKDGSKMGCGLPEYLLLFRKKQTNLAKGYADVPVVNPKTELTRPKWQVMASSFWRSSGNRLPVPDDLAGWEPARVQRFLKEQSLNEIYDWRHHSAVGEALEKVKRLPSTFGMLQPESWHELVWTGINYMHGLNAEQNRRKAEKHICPLPFDIVDRVIECWSMKGDLVFDPFGGLMTVPVRAIAKQRRAVGVELNPEYYKQGVMYLERAQEKASVPSLFELMEMEVANEGQ